MQIESITTLGDWAFSMLLQSTLFTLGAICGLGFALIFGGQFKKWYQAMNAVDAIVILDNQVKRITQNFSNLEEQNTELTGQNNMLKAANEMLRDSNELMRIRIESKQSQTDKKIAELLKDIQEIKDKG